MTDRVETPAFTDAHVHLRQDAMTSAVAPYSGAVCDHVVAMPNTSPPVHEFDQINAMRSIYHRACGGRTDVHMTAKLLPRTGPHHIHAAERAGVVGFKLYPAGVTTNSDDGITWNWIRFRNGYFRTQLTQIEAEGLVLLCHGESTGFVCDRENEFLSALVDIFLEFTKLRVTLEHVTTAVGVQTVRRLHRKSPGRILGTITLHHLETTLDDVLGGKLRPDLFCKPIPKTPADRDALLDAALSGEPCFALGSDSAPHAAADKYGPEGCAGVFTAPVLAEGIVSIFDEHLGLHNPAALDRLRLFSSENANAFYGFTPPQRVLTLERRPFRVPPSAGAVSYRAGQILPWTLVTC